MVCGLHSESVAALRSTTHHSHRRAEEEVIDVHCRSAYMTPKTLALLVVIKRFVSALVLVFTFIQGVLRVQVQFTCAEVLNTVP